MPGIALRSSFSARGLGAFSSQPNWFSFIQGTDATNQCLGVLKDSKNNLYVCSRASNSGLLSKISLAGNLIWSKNFNLTLTSSEVLRMTTDSSDNLYLFVRAPTSALYILKFTPDGTCLWQNRLAMDSTPYIGEIKVTSNVYVSFIIRSPTSTSLRKLAVAKLDTDGNTVWNKVYTTNSSDSTNRYSSLAIDGSGNIFVLQAPDVPVGAGAPSYLFKLDSDGVVQWSKQVRSTKSAFDEVMLRSIALDSSGNIYAVGSLYDYLATSPAMPVAFKFSSAGALQKTFQYAMTEAAGANTFMSKILIDSSDNIYASYSLTYSVAGVGANYQTVLTQLSSDLAPLWFNTWYTTYPGSSVRYSRMFDATDLQSNLVVGGEFSARVSAAAVSATFGTIANLPKSGRSVGIYAVNTSAGLLTTTYVSASSTKTSITVTTTASAYVSTVVTSTTAAYTSTTPTITADSLISYVAQV